jgi:hypothetical protein
MLILTNTYLDQEDRPKVAARASLDLEFAKQNAFGTGLIERCSNPRCCSGWLHPLRKRSRPIFEGGWTCSPACTEVCVQIAVQREIEGRQCSCGVHRHRVPLGLLMLENGWITRQQLQKALEAQRAAGFGRLGEWLIEHRATNEVAVARALGLQWSCPVFSLDGCVPETLANILPRLFVDALDVLPVRIVPGKMLYLGFEAHLDPVLALALERMTGLRVESGIVANSAFKSALAQMRGGAFPPVQLAEALTESAAARLIARAVERAQPAEARLVRVHGFLWMRLTLRDQHGSLRALPVRDVICTVKDLKL